MLMILTIMLVFLFINTMSCIISFLDYVQFTFKCKLYKFPVDVELIEIIEEKPKYMGTLNGKVFEFIRLNDDVQPKFEFIGQDTILFVKDEFTCSYDFIEINELKTIKRNLLLDTIKFFVVIIISFILIIKIFSVLGGC